MKNLKDIINEKLQISRNRNTIIKTYTPLEFFDILSEYDEYKEIKDGTNAPKGVNLWNVFDTTDVKKLPKTNAESKGLYTQGYLAYIAANYASHKSVSFKILIKPFEKTYKSLNASLYYENNTELDFISENDINKIVEYIKNEMR
jgi:hypothetical protein